MPDFVAHALNYSVCRAEVEELRSLLRANPQLGERRINRFLRNRPHLSALIALYNTAITRFDRLAWEYRLFGDFQCDLVVGDFARKAYAFIEFEDAGPKSLFVKQGKKATREWSSHFENGYSQIVDWFYKLQVMTNTPDMEDRFGKRAIDYTGVLIVGREQYQTTGERMRLEWRREHVVVNSKKVMCVTYDQLVEDLLCRLDSRSTEAQAGA
jgi:Domain of unknown function (DUF4263)